MTLCWYQQNWVSLYVSVAKKDTEVFGKTLGSRNAKQMEKRNKSKNDANINWLMGIDLKLVQPLFNLQVTERTCHDWCSIYFRRQQDLLSWVPQASLCCCQVWLQCQLFAVHNKTSFWSDLYQVSLPCYDRAGSFREIWMKCSSRQPLKGDSLGMGKHGKWYLRSLDCWKIGADKRDQETPVNTLNSQVLKEELLIQKHSERMTWSAKLTW